MISFSIRRGALTLLFGALTALGGCLGRTDEAVLPRVSKVIQDCEGFHLTILTWPSTDVGVAGVRATANSFGIATLDVQHTAVLQGDHPRTLTVDFDRDGKTHHYTSRFDPLPKLIPFLVRLPAEFHPSGTPRLISAQATGPCGPFATEGLRDVHDPAKDTLRFEAWGASAVESTTGKASLVRQSAEPLLASVSFEPNFPALLANSNLSAPLTAKLTVHDATGGSMSVDLTLWLGSGQRLDSFSLDGLERLLPPYADIESAPLPEAPPLAAGTRHRLVLLARQPARGWERPKLKGVALGTGPLREVDAVAIYSWRSPSSGKLKACPSQQGPAWAHRLPVRELDGQLEVREARTGKIVAQQALSTPCPGTPGWNSVDPLIPEIAAWLERFSGEKLVLL